MKKFKKALAYVLVTVMTTTLLPMESLAVSATSDEVLTQTEITTKDGDSSLFHETLLSYEDDPISKSPEGTKSDENNGQSETESSQLNDGGGSSNKNSTNYAVTPESDPDNTVSQKNSKTAEAVGADDSTNTITFSFNEEEKTLTITGSGSMENYSSASDVPWIDYRAEIEHIVISNGIESIGNYSFSGFSALIDITIPGSLKSLGVQSFSNCGTLETVLLPDSIESIGFKAFYNCTALESVNIPLNWQEAPSYTSTVNSDYCGHIFQSCSSLKKITIPDGMTSLPSYALCYSDCIEEIVIPDSITEIKNHAFYACSKLKKANIPENITEIGRSVFNECQALSDISIPNSVTTISHFAFRNCKSIESIHIPDSVVSIGYSAFYGCSKLSEINIPVNWQEAPSYTSTVNSDYCGHIFQSCSSLKKITIPDGMTSLPSYALCYSDCIEEIVIPDSITEIKNHAFYACSKLKKANIPENITEIGRSVFNECQALSDISIPNSVTTISHFAFRNCKSLESIHIPDSVVSIGYSAFYGCSKLSEINIPVNWQEAPSYTSTVNSDYCGHIFQSCSSLKKITIPDGMTSLPSYALCYSDCIQEIVIPDSITEIKNHTFYACSKLKKANIPNTVVAIGKSAFCGCSALEEINLPKTLSTLPAYAFNECKSLTQVYIPDSVEKIGYRAFYGCEKLSEINIPLSWNDCPSVSAGSSGTSYQGSIFGGCSALVRVLLPDGISKIPNYGFCNCNTIKDIYLPSSIKTIGIYAFYGCSALMSIDIPNGVVELPKSAFYNCSSLLVINIPKTLNTISQNSFSGCNSLSTVNYAGSEDEWKNITINNTGNTSIGKTHINYNFKVDYHESDFIGTWEGEYDGNSGSIIVRRHFVAIIDSCNCDNTGYGIISGTNTISPSLEANSQYAANGSYYFSGTANLKTGVMFFQGHTWIEYPKNYDNFTFVTFDGLLESGKISITGINDKTSTRTFDADLLNTGFTSNTTVIMTKEKKQYNLLKDKVDVLKSSGDIVTIIVTPDWKESQKGKILLYQDSISVENTTGVFLDLDITSLFQTNKSLFVSLIDANGNTVDTKKLKLRIVDEIKSRTNSQTSNNRITIYQNSNGKYIAAKDAKIEYNGQDYMTDAFGTASIPTVDSGSVTVLKSGFITRTLTAEQLKVSKNIYLEPTNDNAPVVTAVWIENTDVLHDSYPLPMASKDKTTIRAEVDWGKFSYGSIKLWQDGKTANFSNDTLSMVISSQFDTSNTITLIATDSENHQTEKTLLIENSTVNQALKNLDGISFDFNDSINLTLPDSVPLIGGMKVGTGLSSAVPISVSADNGKVYVSIGAQLFHGETKGEKGKSTESKKVIGFINNFKETFKDNTDAVSKLKKFKNTFKNDLAKPKGKFGVEADFTLIGFVEGTFDENGKVTWVDTGLILNPSVSISKDFPFSIGPIPLYFEVGLSAEALAQLNLRLNEQAKNFIPNGELSGKVALSGGVGVGVKKVLYAGGGLEGSLNPDWKINVGKQDYFTLKAKLSAYAKAGILIFEGKKTWDLAEKTLIEYPSKKSVGSVGALLDDYDFYDYSNYKLKDLSYLNSILPESKASEVVGASVYDFVGSTQLKNNIYRESTPQLVVFDNGTKLAVWTDGESSDINGVCLYYSFFNGSSWSSPAKVYNDGTMDYAPQMVKLDGKAYLVWQNATKTFDINDNLSLETIAKDFDISVAVFDGQAFTTTTLQNNNLDMQPVVCANGNNAYVAWVNNSSNDWFGNNPNNSILVSRYEKNAWLQPEIVYSGLNSIDNLAIEYNNGINLAYCVDTDGDINTTDDLRVYENGVLVSGEKNSACSPQYSQHKLYWYSDNSILSSDIEAPETGVINSDRYQLINANGNLAAVFTEANGLCSEVSVSYFNTETGTWGTPKALADNESAIGAFSADTDANGNIEVLINNCAVIGDYDDEEPYGTSSLLLFEDSYYCDISISEPLYEDESFCENEPMKFDFDLTNNGSDIIKGVDVNITDSNGTLLNSVYIEDMIVPGETLESSAFYIPDNSYVSQSVTITATPRNSTDGDLSNNSQAVTLSYENLSVENLTSAEMENGTIAISADIVNWGYQESDSVTVKLIKNSMDGTVVATKTINRIGSLDLQTVSFEVKDKNRNTYFVCIDGDIDCFTSDNSDFVLINRESIIGDVNNDGIINAKDRIYLSRYLAKWDGYEIINDAITDVNCDGIIDAKDRIVLARYLSNWAGYGSLPCISLVVLR